MGNCSSVDELTRMNQLVVEKNQAEKDAQTMKLKLKQQEEMNKKTAEQLNLLRFKTEVLVNMLAIEEGKNSVNAKRIEVLKTALVHEKGITSQSNEYDLKNLMGTNNTVDSPSSSGPNDTGSLLLSFDISGAINTFNEILDNIQVKNVNSNNNSFMFEWFADPEGKLITALDRVKFTQILSEKTKLNQQVADILALRFSDSHGVSIIEFLDFFNSSSAIRRTKAAQSALRMSLDMVTIDDSQIPGDNAEDSKPSDRPMSRLEIAAEKFHKIFKNVEEELEFEFDNICNKDLKIISTDMFKEVMSEVCGASSTIAKEFTKSSQKGKALYLTKDNINILCERFEIAGNLDYSLFLNHFRGASSTKLGISDSVFDLRLQSTKRSIKSGKDNNNSPSSPSSSSKSPVATANATATTNTTSSKPDLKVITSFESDENLSPPIKEKNESKSDMATTPSNSQINKEASSKQPSEKENNQINNSTVIKPTDSSKSLSPNKSPSNPRKTTGDISFIITQYKLYPQKIEDAFKAESFTRTNEASKSPDNNLYIGITGIEKALASAIPNIPLDIKVNFQLEISSLSDDHIMKYSAIISHLKAIASYEDSLKSNNSNDNKSAKPSSSTSSSGKSGGGMFLCCGGGVSGVHDPSNAPQTLPAPVKDKPSQEGNATSLPKITKPDATPLSSPKEKLPSDYVEDIKPEKQIPTEKAGAAPQDLPPKSKEYKKVDFHKLIVEIKEMIEEELGPDAHSAKGMRKAFENMDEDGNGLLDRIEFKKSMRHLMIPLGDGEIEAIFSKFDSDNSGFLDYNEFIDLIASTKTDSLDDSDVESF